MPGIDMMLTLLVVLTPSLVFGIRGFVRDRAGTTTPRSAALETIILCIPGLLAAGLGTLVGVFGMFPILAIAGPFLVAGIFICIKAWKFGYRSITYSPRWYTTIVGSIGVALIMLSVLQAATNIFYYDYSSPETIIAFASLALVTLWLALAVWNSIRLDKMNFLFRIAIAGSQDAVDAVRNGTAKLVSDADDLP